MNNFRQEIEYLLRHEFLHIFNQLEVRAERDALIEKLSRRLWEVLSHRDEVRSNIARELLHSLEERRWLESEVLTQLSVMKEQMAENAIQIERSLNQERQCVLQSQGSETNNLGFIIRGGETTEANLKGRLMADKILAQWLSNAKEVVAIDPYLFKRSQSAGKVKETTEVALAADEAYADELLAVLGKNKTVRLIYATQAGVDGRGTVKVSSGVADRINNQLNVLGLKASFYAVDNLHDRVWLKLDKHGKWNARVIGTSRDGIGKRPTYIIEMDDKDCTEYRSYVDYLVGTSLVSHDELINVKRSRPRRM